MIFVCIKRSLLKNIFCFFFKQKTAYEMRISDWSSDVCSSDLHFRQLFNENFDVPAIGRFVIGRYWRAASPADQKAFLKVFEDAMVQRFLPLLAENSSERLQVGTVTPDSANANMALIDSRINRSQGEPYRVAWRVRETRSELQSLMRISYAVFCLKKKKKRATEKEQK